MLMQIYNDVSTELEIAKKLDELVISAAVDFKTALLEVYHRESWKYLGYENWGQYLKSVGERAQYSTSMLRRWTNAAALAEAAHQDIDMYSEGALRQITEGLSDSKGYFETDRVDALMKAIEYAGEGETVSAAHTRKAVAYTIVDNTQYKWLASRMRLGMLVPETALAIANVLDDSIDPRLPFVCERASDPRLVKMLNTLSKNGSEVWPDLIEEIVATLHVPAGRGLQVPIVTATAEHLLGYLNEPNDLARADAIASERERELARWRDAFVSAYDALEDLVQTLNNMEVYENALSISEQVIEETKGLRARVKART